MTVARLRQFAERMPRPGCEWEERPIFDPPATIDEIARLEESAGFPLPADFRSFLLTHASVVGMSVHNGYWIGGPAQLTGIIGEGSTPHDLHGSPVIPVATDGGGNVFLMTADGVVWKWGHETGTVADVAPSFTAFLSRVADDWAAYIDDTPGWRFLV